MNARELKAATAAIPPRNLPRRFWVELRREIHESASLYVLAEDGASAKAVAEKVASTVEGAAHWKAYRTKMHAHTCVAQDPTVKVSCDDCTGRGYRIEHSGRLSDRPHVEACDVCKQFSDDEKATEAAVRDLEALLSQQRALPAKAQA